MNWWGRSTGLLFLLLVVLLSCEEEISTIGIKKPDPRFRVNYAEIDIPSSVIRFEKVATYNRSTTDDGVQRFLVGQYQDSEFGAVRAEIYTQISPPTEYRIIGAAAVMDSLVLQLKIDFYQYSGSKSTSDQVIQIHELLDTINQVPHYSNSKIPYNPDLLGKKLITIDPVEFDQNLTNNSDNVTTNDKTKNYRIHLNDGFAIDLFEWVRGDSATTYNFESFTGRFKGLAFIPTISDKILGIDPKVDANTLATGTRLILYYSEAGVKKELSFILYPFSSNPVLGFSSIESNLAGTPLQSLEPFKDFFPVDNKRYVQSGTGILTKLDFTKFFEYMDSVESPILNSAELIFENESGDYLPPSAFQFKALTAENKYQPGILDSLIDGKESQIYDPALYPAYQRSVVFNTSNGNMDIMGDLFSASPLYVRAGTTNSISAFVTEFFQTQYAQRKNEKRIKYCAFHPVESQFRKSVNRLVLRDNIKLKIYYTTPVIETKE